MQSFIKSEPALSGLTKYQQAFLVHPTKNDEEYEVAIKLLYELTDGNHPEYKLIRKLGKGGSGAAYLVEDRITEEKKVIKFLSYKNDEIKHIVEDAETGAHEIDKSTSNDEMTLQEINAYTGDEVAASEKILETARVINANKLIAIQDPNIIMPIAEEPIQTGKKWTADHKVKSAFAQIHMKYVEGVSLQEFLNENDDFTVIVSIMRDVLKAIEALHSQGLIHSDIKDANILVSSKDANKARLLDHGLVTEVHDEATKSTKLSEVGWEDLIGTPETVDLVTQNYEGVFSQGSDLLSWVVMFTSALYFSRAAFVDAQSMSDVFKCFSKPGADLKFIQSYKKLINNPEKIPLGAKLFSKFKKDKYENARDYFTELKGNEQAFLKELVVLFENIVNKTFDKRPSAHEIRLCLDDLIKEHKIMEIKERALGDDIQLEDFREHVEAEFTKRNHTINGKKPIKAIYNLMDANAEELFYSLDMQILRPSFYKNRYDMQQYYKQELLSKYYEEKPNLIYAKKKADLEAAETSSRVIKNIQGIFNNYDSSVQSYIYGLNLIDDYTKMKEISAYLQIAENKQSLSKYGEDLISFLAGCDDYKHDVITQLESKDPKNLNSNDVVTSINKNTKFLKLLKSLIELDKLTMGSLDFNLINEKLRAAQNTGVSGLLNVVQTHIRELKGPMMIRKYKKLYEDLKQILNQKNLRSLSELYRSIHGENHKSFSKDSGFTNSYHNWLISAFESDLYNDLSRKSSYKLIFDTIMNGTIETRDLFKKRSNPKPADIIKALATNIRVFETLLKDYSSRCFNV